MRIKKFIDFINEELREDEFNALLDKIHKSGMESLTDEERRELDEFDGEFDRTPRDKVEIDSEGDIRVNGKRMNPYNIPSKFYDDDLKARFQGATEMTPELQELLIDYINDNFEKRQIPGAKKRQIVGREEGKYEPRLHRLNELVNTLAYDLDVEPSMIFNIVKDWYETNYWERND